MKPYSFVISLLLLSFFLTKAQGIRLEKESFAAQQHKQEDQEESHLLKNINSGANKEAIVCKDGQYCTGKLKIRKFVTSSTSTTHDISKNVKNGGNEAHAPEIGSSKNYKLNGDQEKEILVNKLQQELSHEHYPDLVDMDYSPAKKNPPIHN